MNKEFLSDALGYIDDKYISEGAGLTFSENSGKEKNVSRRKLIKIVLLAAAIMSLMAGSAIAVDRLVYSPQRAVEIARRELEKMQEIGLLSEELFIENEPDNILEFQPGMVTHADGTTSSWSKEVEHHYSVRSRADKSSVMFNVDVKDGVVRSFSIEASGDESDNRVDDREFELNGKMYYYYDNYDDIFREDITINEFCAKLSEYWGFGDFKLEKMVDQIYYEECTLPTGDEALSSLCCENYLYVSFEGDKRGEQMCIGLIHFPGRICLNVDRDHLKG